MWTLQKKTERDYTVLRLSGRIEAPELLALYEALDTESVNGSVVLDLSGVRLVDQDAVTFFARYEARGVKLRNCPAYIREWIGREWIGSERAGKEEQIS